jgi:hypothetical protein
MGHFPVAMNQQRFFCQATRSSTEKIPKGANQSIHALRMNSATTRKRRQAVTAHCKDVLVARVQPRS